MTNNDRYALLAIFNILGVAAGFAMAAQGVDRVAVFAVLAVATMVPLVAVLSMDSDEERARKRRIEASRPLPL